MALGVKHGDEISLIARGDGAAAALDQLKQLIAWNQRGAARRWCERGTCRVV